MVRKDVFNLLGMVPYAMKWLIEPPVLPAAKNFKQKKCRLCLL